MKLKGGIQVIYSNSRWILLTKLRRKALEIMTALSSKQLHPSIYGSVARGDVNPSSDIDIIIPSVVSSYAVELAITLEGLRIYSRKITQATPSHVPKAHTFLDIMEKQCVTFPLVSFRTLELEFYSFGGLLDLPSLNADKRVSGCNKNLMLIRPTMRGHIEFAIEDREIEVAKIMKISPEIVKERIRVLTRRKKIGRTGVVLSINLEDGEIFEDVLRRLAANNPIIRRTIRQRSPRKV